jgi:hypothetical protein
VESLSAAKRDEHIREARRVLTIFELHLLLLSLLLVNGRPNVVVLSQKTLHVTGRGQQILPGSRRAFCHFITSVLRLKLLSVLAMLQSG